MNKDKRVEIRIKEILNRSEDYHDVFTPFSLCDEMLEKLPELNENQEILVMFNIEFVYRIKEKNKSLENVWFLTPCDIKGETAKSLGVNENHVVKYSYKIKNIEENMPKFDVVVGNPPYQGRLKNTKRTSLAKKIWPNFVKMSINDFLKDNGYFLFLMPTTWLVKNNKVHDLMFSNTIEYLKLGIAGKELMNVGTIIGWVLLRKTNKGTKEIIGKNVLSGEEKDFHVKYEKGKFISSLNLNNTCDSIFSKTINSNKPKLKINLNSFDTKKDFTATVSGEFKYPGYVKHSKKLYSKEKHINQYDEKLIIFRVLKRRNKNLILHTIYDNESGIINYYGNGNSYILVNSEKEANKLKNYLESKLVSFIISSFQTSALINIPLLKSIPDIDLNMDMTDEKIYEYFNLTKKEIDYIESQVKYK